MISVKTAAPVVMMVYNRPEATRKLLDVINEIRPQSLLVIADGPNANRPDDDKNCRYVRDMIEDTISWPCKFRKRYASENLGCGKNISSGLDWVFSHVDEAVILEDDCIPDISFFEFAGQLLDKYRNNPLVGQVCGWNGLPSKTESVKESYIFSRYGPVWGWAAWKRSWKYYDFKLSDWRKPDQKKWLKRAGFPPRETVWRRILYDQLASGEIDTWDFQWGYAKLKNQLLSIIPKVNLVQNIGFSENATHTKSKRQPDRISAMQFPMLHPETLQPHCEFDRAYSKMATPPWQRLLWQMIRRKLNKPK